jgi:hypothetical protein
MCAMCDLIGCVYPVMPIYMTDVQDKSAMTVKCIFKFTLDESYNDSQ